MNKRVYQKPKVNVIELQHQTHILSGSIQNNVNMEYGGSDEVVDNPYAR